MDNCEICKTRITSVDSYLPCPHCDTDFHTSHFLETIRIFRKCPVCKEEVTQREIDSIVQLASV